MPTANIVYWYGLEDMPRDGGGLRALAWYQALESLGYTPKIIPLRNPLRSSGDQESRLRKAKKLVIPMPLAAALPPLTCADVNIITVPAVFASAATTLPRHSLVFDWMDRWSVNARTMGRSAWVSRPGGYLQSRVWAGRERRLVRLPAANVYAGYEDKTSATELTSRSSFWLPTPISAASRKVADRSNSRVKRVGFIGNFLYPPNVMSLREFFAGYGAALTARGIEIIVAGFGSDVVETWNVQATVVGQIDSLAHFYESIDAAIVPVDHGGGIKAKAVEAMAHGVPVFGTEHVVSGFAPAWGMYIGRVDELLKEMPALPPVVPPEMFREEFSQEAFSTAVSSVLDGLGNAY